MAYFSFKHIVACDINYCIGKNGNLAWHNKKDLAHFRELTLDTTIIMGNTTFMSLPKPLDRRNHIVITRNKKLLKSRNAPENVYYVNSIDLAKRFAGLLNVPSKPIWIIGGESIYRQTLDIIDEVYLTIVSYVVDDGDVYYPIRDIDYKASILKKYDDCIFYKLGDIKLKNNKN